MSGTFQYPMTPIGNKLYIFTSDFEVITIENEHKITRSKIPYMFQGSINLYTPRKKHYKNDKEDFFGSDVMVKNGNIYVLNLFPKKVLTINKLLDNGIYELVWKGKAPRIKKDLIINSFEMID